jgi:hypothetical protein
MLKEKLMSAASACAVVAGMAAFNDDVREYVAGLFDGDALNHLSLARSSTLLTASVVPDTVAFYAADHMPLVFFGLGAVVLLGLMMRT